MIIKNETRIEYFDAEMVLKLLKRTLGTGFLIDVGKSDEIKFKSNKNLKSIFDNVINLAGI